MANGFGSGHTPLVQDQVPGATQELWACADKLLEPARHSQEHQLCQPAMVWVPEAPPGPQLAIDTVGGFAIPQLKPGPHFTAGYASEGAVCR